MPLNSLITTQSPGVVNEYQDFIKRANDINEKGIFYRQDGNKIKYEQEENPESADASGESFDFRFGGEFSSEINV